MCFGLLGSALLFRRRRSKRVKLEMPDFSKFMFSPGDLICSSILSILVTLPIIDDEKTVVANNIEIEMVH